MHQLICMLLLYQQPMASLPYPPWSAPPTIETRQRHRWLSGAKKKLLKPWKKSQASPNQESKKKLWQQSKYSSYGLQNETDGPAAGFPINFSPFRSALNDHHPFRSPLKMSFSAPTSPEKEERESSTFEPPSFRSNRPSVHGLFPKESDRTPNIRPPSATSTGSNSSQERTKERRRRRINSAVRPLALPHERKNSSPASLGISLIEHKKPVNLKRKLSLNLPKDAYSYITISKAVYGGVNVYLGNKWFEGHVGMGLCL